jgi:flagellin
MSLKINTNVSAMIAHKNMIKNDTSLSDSLERLSSGLRINKAADDSSGMAIADSLRSQSLGLGQAIKNANDAISVVQTADGALEESINIVNTIKTKAIQAAQDGQTTDSRKAIQSDIDKLLEELDIIAQTTSFNNQKLLSGNFTNKAFQVGAYSGETVSISIDSTESTKVGHIATSKLTFAGEGTSQLSVYSNILNQTFTLNSVGLAYDNTSENSLGAVADAINKLSDLLGITADAVVSTTADSHVTAGSTDDEFAINGVVIGAIGVEINDANGALVSTINAKTDQHGVIASVDESGVLTLTSTDDRAIQVTADAATLAILGATSDMSTLGYINVTQTGAGQVSISDANAQDSVAVSTVAGSITVSGAVITTQDSAVASGSVLTDTTLGSGTVIAGSFTISGVTTVDDNSIVATGSTIASASVIESGTILQGSFTVSGTAATTVNESIAAAGSVLESTSTLGSGTIFVGDVSASLSGATNSTVVVSGTGENTYTRISGTGVTSVKTGVDLTLTSDATLGIGSDLADDTILTAGSRLEGQFVVKGDTIVSGDMTIKDGSILSSGTILKTGSIMSDVLVSGDGEVTGTMTLETGSTLGDQSILMDGSSIGSSGVLAKNVVVDSDVDMLMTAGSTIGSGSILVAGTYLTENITDDNGTVFEEGTTLAYDITVEGDHLLGEDMVIQGGSTLWAGTTLAVNDAAAASGTTSSLGDSQSYTLSDINVTTQEDAQVAMAIADAALKVLDKVRSGLGSAQNQLTSTIANVTVTQVNITSAESGIRDVDFAGESSNFSKMQILAQAGTFAMAQANAISQNVLSLLQ